MPKHYRPSDLRFDGIERSHTAQPEPLRDWRHAWIHAEGWDAFGIWQEARWKEIYTDEMEEADDIAPPLFGTWRLHQYNAFCQIAGRAPTERETDLPPDVAAYAADPVIDAVRDLCDPYIHIASPDDPF